MTFHARTQDSAADPGMTDEDFRALSRLVHARTGIVLSENKRWMLASRLAKEIRRLGLADFAAYRRMIERSEGAAELDALTSAVTTNVTSFFRGPDHFEALVALIPHLRDKAARGQRIRLWSAACSTRQEPYSMAMTLLEHWPEVVRADLRILATDIDHQVVENARRGVFDLRAIQGEGEQIVRRFSAAGPAPGTVQIARPARELVRFEQLNLLGTWPFKGLFDLILCRNVVIYFDNETRVRLWHRLASRVVPDGWLYIGHSERMDRALDPYLRSGGVTRYRRTQTAIPEPLTVPRALSEPHPSA